MTKRNVVSHRSKTPKRQRPIQRRTSNRRDARPLTLAQIAKAIRREHTEVVGHLRRASRHAKRAGDFLLKAKAQLNHGQWLPWLEKHCQLAERTAQLYMQVARHWKTLQSNPQWTADLPLSRIQGLLGHRPVSQAAGDSGGSGNGDTRAKPGARDGQEVKDKGDVSTPLGVCQLIHDLIAPAYRIRIILDPCAGGGNLTRPWAGSKVIDFEKKRKKNFFQHKGRLKVDLVVCNPPFSQVERFLEHILKVVGKTTPIALVTPASVRLAAKIEHQRWRWLRDECPPITGIISLPSNIFAGGYQQCEVLLFNLPKLTPHYFMPDEYLSGAEPAKAKAA